ncbi:trypsin-like serine protease [Streptomyces sp. ICBB 8177]|uniref:trypsin-like serine peptidase n=1 Tax=Streptomyces sp. ICBB 8177 TaxID=563922 RepID=UPI000D675A59|nr:trypsin-like serine protease [Streptomyces sp. ICBB 8177]PWI42726.1 hypothetical protein CK485_10520 [Streptomyces sp. ICBB 8177]
MRRSRSSRALPALSALLLGLTACLAQAPAADAAGRPHGRGSAAVADDAYWTAGRMRSARPQDDAVPGPVSRAGTVPVPPSHPFPGLPQVGTFFWTDGQNQDRSCGATVVRSPVRDLVISAGHCLTHAGAKKDLAFVPMYHDGLKPYGVFPVEAVYIDQRYYTLGSGEGARWDYSLSRLEPRADGRQVQDVVGGFDLMTYPGYAHRAVRLVGYPGYSDTTGPEPLDCWSSTRRYTSTDPNAPGDFLEIGCAGYVNGTSGGPFLVRASHGFAVIGVIGGYHTGGDTPDISYSAYFTADLSRLYAHAVHGDPPAGPAS